MNFLKSIFLIVWAVVVVGLTAWGLWAIWPYVMAHPKMWFWGVLAFATAFRYVSGFLQGTLLLPYYMVKELGGVKMVCGAIIGLGTLACAAIPWLHGVSGWNGWQWAVGIGFSVLCVEMAVTYGNLIIKEVEGQ